MVNRLKELKDAVALLASAAESQLTYLATIEHNKGQEFGDLTNIDEIVLQFEDASYAVKGLTDNGDISESAQIAIEKLSSELLHYSGRDASKFWTVRALMSDTRWGRIRELASDSLRALSN